MKEDYRSKRTIFPQAKVGINIDNKAKIMHIELNSYYMARVEPKFEI